MEDNIQIDPEIEGFITPLQLDQLKQLELNILQDGCRDPLIVWKAGRKNILIDGHNRYKICKKHNIQYKTIELEYNNIEDVKLWLITNQIGRRNLSPLQLSYLRGLKYNRIKKKLGGYKNIISKGKINDPSSLKLAKEFQVSESTVKRDASFAKGIDFIGEHNPEVKKEILLGLVSFKKGDILFLSNNEIQKKIRKIINEKDLKTKISKIRNSLLKNIESDLKNLELPKPENITIKEPIFLDTIDEKINHLKGRILSSINVAIKNKNVQDLEKIYPHLEKLKNLISHDI